MSTPAARTATLAEALREVVSFHLSNVHTVMPGKIQSYDKDAQTADIVLCIKRRVHTESGDDILEDFPPLPNVRIEFPQTANFFMSFPLAAGDFVWVHFGEQSLDAWFTRGGTSIEDPIDRRFDLSDAFAVPARDPNAAISQASSSAVVIGSKSVTGARAYFKDTEIALGSENPASAVALANADDANWRKLSTVLQTYNPGDFGASFVAALTTLVSTGWPNSVAAQKVKAE